MRIILVALGAAALVSACGFPSTASTAPALSPSMSASPAVVAGHDRFVATCNGCHGYPALTAVDDKAWPDVMKKMGEKAKLSPQETDEVLQFILAARRETAAHS